MNGPYREGGFALVLTLVVLALVGSVLAAAAWRSNLLALEANAAQDSLQRRWAMTTLQHTFLDRTEQVISEAEVRQQGPLSWAEGRFELGGMKVRLVFGDEQAKANANAIHARTGWLGLSGALGRFLAAGNCRLRPAALEPDPGSRTTGQPAFQSWNQLLEEFAPGEALKKPLGADSLVNQLTLWGDGRINFRRAGRAALEEATSGILDASQQTRLLTIRQEIPGIGLQEAVNRLELTDQQRPLALSALTDQSGCFALWIVLESPCRQWHRLTVVSASAGSAAGGTVQTFSW